MEGDDEVSAARKLTLRSPTTPSARVHFDHTMFSRGITECNSMSRLRGLSGPLSTVCTADTYTPIIKSVKDFGWSRLPDSSTRKNRGIRVMLSPPTGGGAWFYLMDEYSNRKEKGSKNTTHRIRGVLAIEHSDELFKRDAGVKLRAPA